MMHRIPFQTLTVTLRSPGHFGSEPMEGNILRSLSYIPAQTVRGALANLYRQQAGQAVDEAFFAWAFLSGAVRWPNLYFTQEPFLPKSVRQCKYSASSSTTSNSSWMPISARLCWMYSFTGSDSI